MSNVKNYLKPVSNRTDKIETRYPEGSLNLSIAFRNSLAQAIKSTTRSRWEISGHISELLGRNISKDMLDKYTSSCLDTAFRAEELTAFCVATDSIEPIKALIEPLGYELIGPDQADLIRLYKLEQQKSDLEAEIARLKAGKGKSR
jgi:hypothetical protein